MPEEAGSSVLTPFEAEAYAENLKLYDVKSVGSSKWLQQHEYLEKLNVQAHVNVTTDADEFVQEALILAEKIPTLIHELIAIEVWREKVYPKLVELDFCSKSTMTAYMVLYHEATVISLLEAIFFNKETVEAAGDAALDLTDYCYRRIIWLNSLPPYEDGDDTPKSTKEMLEQSGQEQLEDQIKTLPFDIATKAVSIMRYIVDHLEAIPLSCLTRILNTHDLPCALVPLIMQSPWQRTKGGQLEKHIDGEWAKVEPGDRFKLTKAEAQAWLGIYTMMQDSECRKKYKFTTHNKNELLRLRGQFNDMLIDQIPNLQELRRTLEELGMMEPPAPEPSMVLEQVPEIWDHLLKVNGGKWGSIAKYQHSRVFCTDQKTMMEQAKRLAGTYDLDTLESLLPEDPKCVKCGELATMRCSRCKNEWYCRRQCQVEHWKQHKAMCNMIYSANKDAESTIATTCAAVT